MAIIKTPELTQIEVEYRWITRPLVIAGAVFFMVAIFLIYTIANPSHEIWHLNSRFDWINALKYLFLEVYLIELISGALLFNLIRIYAHVFSIKSLVLSLSGIVKYQLKFLPLFLTVFFIINPVTQTIRYWYEYFPQWNPSVYFTDYWFSLRLYLVYLIPFFLMGYAILNLNLVLQFNQQQQTIKPGDIAEHKEKGMRNIKVIGIQGESFIPVETIMWFIVENRRYFAITPDAKMRVSLPLDKLEEALDAGMFFRVNRSVIVNLRYVKSYAYWEHDKYILHMTDADQTSFTLTRQRMKQLKGALEEFASK